MKLPKSFTTVTPFTRIFALSMLIIFPICGFFFGMYYQQLLDINKPQQVIIEYKMQKQTYSPTPPVGSDEVIICKTNSDCPLGDFCTRAGPIVYDLKTRELPPMTCHKRGTMVPF